MYRRALLVLVCYVSGPAVAHHSLTSEEMLAYLACVLARPQVWAVQAAALLSRSLLERERPRTLPRALQQLQVPCVMSGVVR